MLIRVDDGITLFVDDGSHTVPLPPKRERDSETAWRDPWEATREQRLAMLRGSSLGALTTDEINRDPDEVARLRLSRQQARAGQRSRRRDEEKSN